MNAPAEIMIASVRKNRRSAYAVAVRDIGDGPSVSISVLEENGKRQLVHRRSGVVIKAAAIRDIIAALEQAEAILGGAA